jgi:hypothetical protein
VSSLVTDLGLRGEAARPAGRGSRHHVVGREGDTVAVRPTQVWGVLGSPLLSPGGKLRWLAEPLACLRPVRRRRRLWRPSGGRGDAEAHAETAAAFLTRHFGVEAMEVLYPSFS